MDGINKTITSLNFLMKGTIPKVEWQTSPILNYPIQLRALSTI